MGGDVPGQAEGDHAVRRERLERAADVETDQVLEGGRRSGMSIGFFLIVIVLASFQRQK